MKTSKLTGLIASGILALLLAGCFNPITVVPPNTLAGPLAEPFTMDVVIGEGTAARSVAGPDADRIKDIFNIAQLIVTDNEGKIVAFDEVRRSSVGEGKGELRIDTIPFNQTYHFLLLMGYWNHNNYQYSTTELPTLVAAGMKDQLVTGSGTITITMWPLVVDTVFTTADSEIPSESRKSEPVVNSGKPRTADLYPVDWGVTWTVKRGIGGNGFTDLVRAQKVGHPQAGDNLLVKSMSAIVRGDGLGDTTPAFSMTQNVISLSSLGKDSHETAYTSGLTRVGKKGSVNFKLEYVPFNLTGNGVWTKYNDESAFTLNDNTPPVWIIRNGMNDDAQNAATDFSQTANGTTVNWNGAVSYLVKADAPENPGNPQTGDLVVKDGVFEGPTSATTAAIGFTTAGYTSGKAIGYYAVVSAGTAPAYSAYTGSLGLLDPKVHTGKGIALSESELGSDVYVVILKGGKMSAPLKISTTGGSSNVDWQWGIGGRFIAYNDQIANWSDDGGQTWTALPSFPSDRLGIAYGNGVFVAIGNGTASRSDDDGETWTATSLPAGYYSSIIYGNGVFVAIGDGVAAWSDDDGETWWTATSDTSEGFDFSSYSYTSMTYGNGVFVAIGEGVAAWSDDDGQIWKKGSWTMNDVDVTLNLNDKWESVVYGDGKFIARGCEVFSHSFSGRTAWSDDGKTWNIIVTDIGPDPEVISMAYGDGVLVALGMGSIYISGDDGVTWETDVVLPDSSYSTDYSRVTYGNGVFVIVGASSNALLSTNAWTLSEDMPTNYGFGGFTDVVFAGE